MPQECPYVAKLMGQFTLASGAQEGQRWLAFHSVGGLSGAGAGTAGAYSQAAAKATEEGAVLGQGEFTDMFDKGGPMRRRKIFILKVRLGAIFFNLSVDVLHAVHDCALRFSPVPFFLVCKEFRNSARCIF